MKHKFFIAYGVYTVTACGIIAVVPDALLIPIGTALFVGSLLIGAGEIAYNHFKGRKKSFRYIADDPENRGMD